MAARFVHVYEMHGVLRTEISEFIAHCGGPSLALRDLTNDTALVDRLDAELLDFTTNVFALHGDYLRRPESEHLYPRRSLYKMVDCFPHLLLVEALSPPTGPEVLPLGRDQDQYLNRDVLYLISTRSISNDEQFYVRDDDLHVGAILMTRIAEFRDRDIWRYYPIDAMPWYYWKSRRDLLSGHSVARLECEVPVIGKVAYLR